ncbi:MAG: STAS/SEC14 domain-containing protein [Hymenobacter sp.]|nr:MAG: STAS/SEC14 domain-containing protein [Hymenobacter sp.]
MFTVIDYPDQNLLSFTIAGTLTKEDYNSVVPILSAKVQHFGKVNVYLEIGEMDAVTLPALWEEVKQDAKHFADFNRTAVVSADSLLLKAAAAVAGTVTPAEVKHFAPDQKAEALQWAFGADPTQLASKQVYQTAAAS